ncbi:MAG: GIY-YIG nuclease family protein [bacterium]|nr:GIY-YIG nuclease family protein [bacterium]
MIIVYAIHDIASNQVYVGMTNNLDRRLSEHKRGQSFYTKNFKNFNLIYQEECNDYASGRKREKYFKSGCGKEFLKNLIK